MIRNGDTLYFTEEDKKNVVYKEYSKAKIEEQQMKFKKKQHRRRMSYAAILLILIMMTRCEQILIFTGVAICFVIFLILIGEWIDRMHIWRPYYIEIQVEKNFL